MIKCFDILQVQVRSAADSEARSRSGPNRARLAEEENWTKLDYFDADVRDWFTSFGRLFVDTDILPHKEC